MDLSVVFSKLRSECLRQIILFFLWENGGTVRTEAESFLISRWVAYSYSIKASLKMNPYTVTILCFSVYCSLLLVSIALLVMLDKTGLTGRNKQGIAFHRKSCFRH